MAVQSRGSHICMWRPLFGLRFRPCAAQGSCGLPGTYHAFRGGPLSRGVRTALELQGTYSTFCGRPRSRLPKKYHAKRQGFSRAIIVVTCTQRAPIPANCSRDIQEDGAVASLCKRWPIWPIVCGLSATVMRCNIFQFRLWESAFVY